MILQTQDVAATSFFTGEVEIFDFVTERVKRCIAAKMENGRRNIVNVLSEDMFINCTGFRLHIL